MIAASPSEGADFQNGIAIQHDGKVLVGGESDMGADAGEFQWRITRLHAERVARFEVRRRRLVPLGLSDVGGFDERLISLTVQKDRKSWRSAGWRTLREFKTPCSCG